MNVTYVTGLYRIYDNSVNEDQLLKNVDILLKQNIDIIVYTDEYFYPKIKHYNSKNKKIILLELELLDVFNKLMNSNACLPKERNLEKDTKRYLTLMNCKVEFLKISLHFIKTGYLCWIDVGIAKIFKNNDTVTILSTLKIKDGIQNVLIPGPYKRNVTFSELCNNIWWLFCGGFLIVNTDFLQRFYDLCLETLDKFLSRDFIVWEVNLWADIYINNPEVFTCYVGDHNDSIIDIPEIYLDKSIQNKVSSARNIGLRLLDQKKYIESYNSYKDVVQYADKFPNIYEDLYLILYWMGKKDKAMVYIDRLLYSYVSETNKKIALKNLVFYAEKIGSVGEQKSFMVDCPSEFIPSSSSIYRLEDKYLMNVRTVNYSIDGSGRYSIRHPKGEIHSKNYLLTLDKDFNKLEEYEIFPELSTLSPKYDIYIKGLEDSRIFNVEKEGNKLYSFSTCCQCYPFFVPRIVYSCYNMMEKKEMFIKHLILPDIDKQKCEKNWLPFIDNDGLVTFIYSFNPLMIYKIDENSNIFLYRKKIDEYLDFDTRGSASPIKYKDGWLMTVHQIEDSTPRKYYHRLIWFDGNFKKRKFSKLFYFEKVGIEFNLGICSSIDNDSVVFSFSVNDNSSKICVVKNETIDEMLTHSERLFMKKKKQLQVYTTIRNSEFSFDKNNTFCISLERDKDRWSRMSEKLEKLGMECTRWKASTPNDLIDRFYDNLNGGQKGCAQSHINIWRHIVKNDLSYALVLEDDVLFDKKWREKLNQLSKKIDISNVPQKWDMIMLNNSEPIAIKDQWVIIEEVQYSAGAYIISNAGAKYILEMFSNCFAAADWMTTRMQQRGRSYSYYPWLAIQEGTSSTIGSNFEADRAKAVRCLNEINYSLDNYIDIEPKKDKIAMVTYTDFKYWDRCKKTIEDIRGKGKYHGDLVVMTDGGFKIPSDYSYKMNLIIKEYPDIDVSNLIEKIKQHPFVNSDKREYEKTKQWNKMYVFDIWFKQWDYVFFVDAGLRIFDKIEYFYPQFKKDSIVATDDGYPRKFSCQIEMTNTEVVNKLKEIYDINSSYFLNCLFIFDTSLIKENTLNELINMMNEYPICRTNEMGIMNIYFHKYWVPLEQKMEDERILFNWSEMDGNDYKHYVSLKYSTTFQ